MATIVRSPKIRTTNFSLDREARIILDRCCSTQKARGHFLSRLLHEYLIRLEARAERDVAYQELMAVYGLPEKKAAVGAEE